VYVVDLVDFEIVWCNVYIYLCFSFLSYLADENQLTGEISSARTLGATRLV